MGVSTSRFRIFNAFDMTMDRASGITAIKTNRERRAFDFVITDRKETESLTFSINVTSSCCYSLYKCFRFNLSNPSLSIFQ